MKFLLSSFCDKVNGDYRNDTKGIKNLREFQKAVGYTFSTSTREEKIFILQGRTRSGKSTAMDTINEIMKDYCGDKQDEEYITSKDQNSNYLLSVRAQQKGTRYMQISEISKKNKLNGATIKRLAGDRLISAKFMHQNSFTYTQQTKYWITTNNIDFNEFDESISTKLFIIDFNKRCYEAGTEEAIKTGRVIDKDLKERLLLPYNKEFILKWIIEGYELYLREGLTLTEDMRETIEQLEQENDSIGMFIKDNMSEYDESKEYISGQKADTKVIYEKYKQYEMDNYNTPEEMVITFRRFIKNMRNRGFEIKRQYVNYDKSRNLFIINWRLNYEQTKEY